MHGELPRLRQALPRRFSSLHHRLRTEVTPRRLLRDRGAAYGLETKTLEVILAWNKAQVYAHTIAYFAERLDGMR